MRTSFIVLFAVVLALLSGCRSSDMTSSMSAEDRYELGKKQFDDEDFLEAIEHLSGVTVQFPGSAVADDAQYYLAECRFRREEFLLASYEYETLKRNWPSSQYAPLAQYKIGLCFYQLSPRAVLDQKYARRSIDEFQAFIEYFPTHELLPDAEAKIKDLNNRLAEKDYRTAVLYSKMEYYKAAHFYFASVLEKFPDSDFAEPAYYGKIESLVMRKKYQEALVEIEKFLMRYPESKFKSSIDHFRSEAEKGVGDQSATGGSQSPSLMIGQP